MLDAMSVIYASVKKPEFVQRVEGGGLHPVVGGMKASKSPSDNNPDY